VQAGYRDALGHVREPSEESLRKTLLALGARVEGPAGLRGAIREREAELWGRLIEPVLVAWEGDLPGLTLRLPASARLDGVAGRAPGASRPGGTAATAHLTLVLEEGASIQGDMPLSGATAVDEVSVEGRGYLVVWVPPGLLKKALGGEIGRLPWGRHRLRVEIAVAGARTGTGARAGVGARAGAGIGAEAGGEALVISAPRRCWEGGELEGAAAQRGALIPGGAGDRAATIDAALSALAGKPWGLFAPVYALRSARDWGAGDLVDLGALMDWTGQAGGALVATLPMLASAFAEDGDPSPYRPLSRLFWNEFFLAPERTEEWIQCHPARLPWDAAAQSRRREVLRQGELVDYEAVMALKRPVLRELARYFFTRGEAGRWQDYKGYLAENPLAEDYAAFRAARAMAGPSGATASAAAPAEAGAAPGDEEQRYHLYCQWQMDRQLAGLARSGGPGLLFDLPLGVHPRGFDVATWPGLFAAASSGAPPDRFFADGQVWTTPPLHPQADRLRGYPYFSACLKTLMRHAASIRVDHMMSFHRLFWIPDGAPAKDGVYVTYPAEELYALLSCESHRSRTTVVGEDLGTVPAGVRASMRRHAVARTTVFLGGLRPRAKNFDPEVPAGALATIETHDMTPLAGFLHGDDIEMRVETGQLDPGAARREAAARRRLVVRMAERYAASGDDMEGLAPAILAGSLGMLAHSAAKMVLVNLDDLLLERHPQNVPGTAGERENWRRKVAVPLEDLPRYKDSSK
jgi:4-alpha-glucanotransferase